ncbi:MAG: hypothetical protein KKA42_10095, partial [candidate division Zixibacteria bacterium]|nr:hypothetical protein [candidate division Zixibacteria bacterium]
IFGPSPVVIGHRNLRARLQQGSYLFDEYSEETLPDLLFDDSLSLFFNGEEIKLIAVPGGHSSNDIVVWFTGSKVACVGALSNGSHFPSVDESGDVLKYAAVAKRIIDMLPEDTKIIPGHGADGTMADFRSFHAMLEETAEIIRIGLEQGKDLETLQKEGALDAYESFGGSYTSKDKWIQYLVEGFHPPEEDALKSIVEPMYYAIRDHGVKEAVAEYYRLKQDAADEYRFIQIDLIIVGYKLFLKERYADAIPFLDLYGKEYPAADYTELSYQLKGQAYQALDDNANALIAYQKVLELNPDNTEVAALVEELQK